MMKSRSVPARLAAFALATLIVAGGVRPAARQDGSAIAPRLFSAALGEAEQNADLQKRYDEAQAYFDAQDYQKALEAFEALGKYADSRARASESRKKWKAARYREAVDLYKAEEYQQAREIFIELDNYKESRRYATTCGRKVAQSKYDQAKELYKAGDYAGALALFESIGKFRDSPDRAQAAAERVREQEQAAAELRAYEKGLALKEAGDLEGARAALIEAGDHPDATDQLYEVVDMLALRAVYDKALRHERDGAFEDAYDLFAALGAYEDSAARAEQTKDAWLASVYEQADAARDGDPARACILYLFLGGYRDSAQLAEQLRDALTPQAVYDAADALAGEGEHAKACLGFEAASPCSDWQERAAQESLNAQNLQQYKQALYLKAIREKEQANAIFKALGSFRDARLQIERDFKRISARQLRDDKTSPVSPVFTAPDGTKHRYQIYKGVHTWVEAKAFCEILGGHLATLTTPEENEFVYRFMRDCGYLTAYFGLSDEERKGNWIWVTGEPFEYKNWHRGEPSRSARERYGMYLYMHTDGTWNDAHFYEHAEVDPGCSYICEWDD